MLGSVLSESLALIFGNSQGDSTVHNQKDGWVTNCKSIVQLKFRSRRHSKKHHTKFSKSNFKVLSLGMMIWFYDIPEKQYVRQEKRLLYYIQMKNCAESGALYLRKSWLLPADHIFIYCFMPWTACLQVLESISSPLLHNLSWLFCFVTCLFLGNLGDCLEDHRRTCFLIPLVLKMSKYLLLCLRSELIPPVHKSTIPKQTGRGSLVLFEPIVPAWTLVYS